MTAPAQAFEHVRYAVEDNVATITLDRPERRNALNYQAYDELETAFRHVVADPEARCVIVTGADPAFCSGDDVREIMAGPRPLRRAPRRQWCATGRRPRPWRLWSATSR